MSSLSTPHQCSAVFYVHWLPVPQQNTARDCVAFHCVRNTGPAYFRHVGIRTESDSIWLAVSVSAEHSDLAVSRTVKLEFHDADTDTDILATILARMSVSVSVSWNASLTELGRRSFHIAAPVACKSPKDSFSVTYKPTSFSRPTTSRNFMYKSVAN